MCSPYLSSLSSHTVSHLSRNYGNQLVTMLGSIIACTNGYLPYQFSRAVVWSCCWSVITMLEGYQRWSIVLTPSVKPFLIYIFSPFWILQRSVDQVFLTGVCLFDSRILFTMMSTVTWEYCRNWFGRQSPSRCLSRKIPLVVWQWHQWNSRGRLSRLRLPVQNTGLLISGLQVKSSHLPPTKWRFALFYLVVPQR